MGRTIVVTGGAGFIGSNLVKRLNELGEENILIVDNIGSTDKWKNLVGLSFEDYIQKDLFIKELLSGSMDGKISVIFHLGARSSTTESDVEYLLKNNYEYTKRLAEWAVEKKVRFIYASSGATYGDGSAGFSDDHNKLHFLRPLNAYGFSKHLFDMWALKRGLLNQIVGLKYFNVFGPNEFHKGEMRSMVLKAYDQIRREGKVRLFKSYNSGYRDGEQRRDFIYIKDAVEMSIFFLEHPDLNGIFNIGTGVSRTWNDLAKAVFHAMGKEPRIEYVEMPEGLQEKYQYHTEADISKLRRSGYKNDLTTLEDGVREYVGWLLKQDHRINHEKA